MTMANAKTIYNRSDFQKQVLDAVKILAEPVKSTLGPDGVPIAIQRDGLPPLITKDGVTVANSIFVESPALSVIVEAIKEVAINTNNSVGDGTTSSVLFTESIIKHSQPYLQTGAITPQVLADSLLKVAVEIAEGISRQSIQINSTIDSEKIKFVASLSCNGDDEIANIVAEAIDKVGVDGSITLAEGGSKTSLSIEEGFSIENGFGALGQHGKILINNQALQQVVYNKPAIVVYDGHMDEPYDFITMLGNVNCGGQDAVPIVVFAHDFSPKIIEVVVVNAAASGLKCLLVKVPRLGTKYSQSNVCDDISILTGAITIKPGVNTLKDILSNSSEFLGGADKIVSSSKQTTIYDGLGSEEEILERSGAIKVQIDEADSEFDKGVLRERLGRLVGGVAVVRVGAQTDLEMKEKKDRIEDALNATKAAIAEGIVPGGGTAMLLAFKDIIERKYEFNKEYKIAIDIFEKVCESSIRQIVANTGKNSADVILNTLFGMFKNNRVCGFNARANKIEENMVESGIIDPTKVVRTALLNATSIATTLLRAGGSIVFKADNNKKNDPSFFMNGDE